MKLAAIALLACGCNSAEPPPVVGEPPAECVPPAPPSHDDVFIAPPPVGWLLVALPVSHADCTGSTTPTSSTSSLTWRDRGTVRSEPLDMRSTSTLSAVGDRCVVRFVTQVLGGPAGRAGSVQPCQVLALSDAWASLQQVALSVDAITVDDVRTDLAWPVTWGDTLGADTECRDTPPIERPALGLTIVTELSIPLADFRRMAGAEVPLIAIATRIDAD